MSKMLEFHDLNYDDKHMSSDNNNHESPNSVIPNFLLVLALTLHYNCCITVY